MGREADRDGTGYEGLSKMWKREAGENQEGIASEFLKRFF